MTLFIGTLEQLSVAQEINQQEPPAPLSSISLHRSEITITRRGYFCLDTLVAMSSMSECRDVAGALCLHRALWVPAGRHGIGAGKEGTTGVEMRGGGGHDGLLQDEPFNVLWGHGQTGLAGLLLSVILTLRKNRVLVMIFAWEPYKSHHFLVCQISPFWMS